MRTCWDRPGRRLGLRDDAGLLGAGDEVVDEHAEAPSGSRLELGDDAGEVVDAVHELDDDALDAQVVAPDLLDELGVVTTLDVDPRPARDARSRALDGDRAARGPGRGPACVGEGGAARRPAGE